MWMLKDKLDLLPRTLTEVAPAVVVALPIYLEEGSLAGQEIDAAS
jgi:hypothetical protein